MEKRLCVTGRIVIAEVLTGDESMVDNCIVIKMSDFYECWALHLLIAKAEEESGSSHSSDEASFVSSDEGEL